MGPRRRHKENPMINVEFAAGIAAILIALLWPGSFFYRYVRDFFLRPEGPWNLALFRVFFFFWYQKFGLATGLWMSQVPAEFRKAPPGYDALMAWIPFSYDFYLTAQGILYVSCGFVIAGLWTRFFAAVAAAAGFYVLGLPNFFGKINHGSQHMIWFAVLFACSRCADVLSVDSVLKAWRQGSFREPLPSLAYSLPLRFMMLLVGLIYFFSGLWKVITAGDSWIFSDNLMWIFRNHWMLKEFLPSFRIDHYPLLCRAAALSVVVIEISFLLLIFHPSTRILAAAGALLFHKMTVYFLRINFFSLQICLFPLVNWAGLLKKAGAGILKNRGPLRVPVSPRFFAVLQTADAAGVLARDAGCEMAPLRVKSVRAAAAAGSFLVAAQLVCGISRFDSWPFGLYPTFAYTASPYHEAVQAQAVFNKTVQQIDFKVLMKGFHGTRWMVLQRRILNASDETSRETLLRRLTHYIVLREPKLAEADEIRYSKAVLANDPERWMINPIGVKGLGILKPELLFSSRIQAVSREGDS